ncbi:MAG TPA: class I lanthipeptide [Thermoanaerobaculia bacterium]|nr:class I lanthipeptide [Thermoanaerobaculia bacterium]
MKKTKKLTLHRETLRDLNELEQGMAVGGIIPPKNPDPATNNTSCVTWAFTCVYTAG